MTGNIVVKGAREHNLADELGERVGVGSASVARGLR